MTVSELIEELEKLPPDCEVKIAFDMGIRMDCEVAKMVRYHNSDYVGDNVVVLTDKYEWDDRENW